ncbi:uncharacterized protein V1516DRAFT_114745 [Lipomyces oligophaga]|uniref:uncharacterized protein n=1 Tax=Lipomyces oligophaga TaxID=45792 RepID=UPI0034CEF4F5
MYFASIFTFIFLGCQLLCWQVEATVTDIAAEVYASDESSSTYTFVVDKSIVRTLGTIYNLTQYPSDISTLWQGASLDNLKFMQDLNLNISRGIDLVVYDYTMAIYLGDTSEIGNGDFVATYNEVVDDVNTYTAYSAKRINVDELALLSRQSPSTHL